MMINSNNISWKNKKVFLRTISGRFYTGTCIEETNDYLTILDKYDQLVIINKGDLQVLQEDKVK